MPEDLKWEPEIQTNVVMFTPRLVTIWVPAPVTAWHLKNAVDTLMGRYHCNPDDPIKTGQVHIYATSHVPYMELIADPLINEGCTLSGEGITFYNCLLSIESNPAFASYVDRFYPEEEGILFYSTWDRDFRWNLAVHRDKLC